MATPPSPTPRAPIKVMVADDHSIFRIGIMRLLQSDSDLAVVAESRNGNQAVELAVQHHLDLVLMDLNLPGMDGITATRRIRELCPATKVVIITASDDQTKVFEALEAGASGYIVKDDDPQAILQALHDAVAGKSYLAVDTVKRVLEQFTRTVSRRPALGRSTLSKREETILALIVGGRTNREVAAQLGISQRTVANHVANIYSKLHVQDRAQAVLAAVKQGLVRI